MTLEVCVNYRTDPLAHLLSSKHETVPASAEYSGRIIRDPLFVFEAIIRAFPNKVFASGTPLIRIQTNCFMYRYVLDMCSLNLMFPQP